MFWYNIIPRTSFEEIIAHQMRYYPTESQVSTTLTADDLTGYEQLRCKKAAQFSDTWSQFSRNPQ